VFDTSPLEGLASMLFAEKRLLQKKKISFTSFYWLCEREREEREFWLL
jgi:hypothetical protein